MDKVSLQEVINILETVVCLSGSEINQDSVLGEDIAIDSTDMLRIISRLEAKYQLKFKMREILEFNTVGDLVQAINHNLRAR